MKKIQLSLVLVLGYIALSAQTYSVGVKSLTWTDASRSNRSVPVEFHYPGTNTSIAAYSFGFVVFGHGFDMTIDAYYNYADSLASHGYIVALTSNEGGLSPTHINLAQDLIYIYNMMISESRNNSSSILYHHVKGKGSIAGHSMGGGCTVLSCQYSDTATCYWTLAEATTNPSSVTAAPMMHKPYLSFAGGNDCIAPASTNQIPTYDSSGSICKTFIEIANATHCQFAISNVACNFGEGVSGCASTPLSRSAQTNAVLNFLYPYLDYYLNGNCSAWTLFESRYNADAADVLMQSCNNVIPGNPAITGAHSFCNGTGDLLTANPSGFIYNWSNNSTGSSISVSNSGTYSLTVSNGTCALTSAPFTVTQSFPPSATTSITASDTVCSGISNISISVSNDTSVSTYNWTLPTGWNISAGNNTHSITAVSGTTGGTISVTAQNSCGTSTAVQKNVVVIPSNLGSIGSITGDSVVCQGQSVQYLTAPVSGANSYLWNYPSGWTLTSQGSGDTIILIAGALSGNITAEAVNGCGQGLPSSLNVTTKTTPVAGSISGTDTVCINSAIPLSFTLSGSTGADSIYWSVPNIWNMTSGQGTTNVSFNNNQSGGVINAAVINLCGTSNALPVNLVVIDTPQAGITQTHDTLKATSGTTYQWYLNDSAIAGANEQNYVASQNGNYTVTVANAYNCTGSSSAFHFTTVGINSLTSECSITIYPNPSATGFFQLLVNAQMIGTEIKINDESGREILRRKITHLNSQIDLSGMSKGIYFATFDSDVSSIKKKLVIQ